MDVEDEKTKPDSNEPDGTEDAQILVVDDDKAIRESIQEAIRYEGYACRVAGSGEEALELLQEAPADLVVADVKMPGLSGLDVLQKIREEHPEVAVLMLTGHGSKRDAEKGMRLGAYDYLVKPVSIGVLSQLLRDAGSGDRTDRKK